jgi:hypothetical protein
VAEGQLQVGEAQHCLGLTGDSELCHCVDGGVAAPSCSSTSVVCKSIALLCPIVREPGRIPSR